MGGPDVERPVCSLCQHLHKTGPTPELSERGALRANSRYCLRGKEPRRFRRGDPTRYIPNWCERIQRLPKLRVYAFKDYESFCRIDPLGDDWVPREPPDPGDYKLWFEGHLNGMDASALCRRARRMPLAQLCGVVVHCGHIIEIDDNIAPVLLCQTRQGLVRCRGFNQKTVERIT